MLTLFATIRAAVRMFAHSHAKEQKHVFTCILHIWQCYGQ